MIMKALFGGSQVQSVYEHFFPPFGGQKFKKEIKDDLSFSLSFSCMGILKSGLRREIFHLNCTFSGRER